MQKIIQFQIVPADNNEAKDGYVCFFDKIIDFLQFNKMILVINKEKLKLIYFQK